MIDLTKEWIEKAEKDYRVAARELAADPPEFDAVCFHSQQCVEKYLKAALQENGVLVDRTHDLDVLLEKCKPFLPELSNLKQQLIELSSFAVEIRYPGVDAAEDDARQNFSVCEKARTIVRTHFALP